MEYIEADVTSTEAMDRLSKADIVLVRLVLIHLQEPLLKI